MPPRNNIMSFLPRHEGVALLPVPPPEEVIHQRREDIPCSHGGLQLVVGQELLTHGRHAVGVVLCEAPRLHEPAPVSGVGITGDHS